MFSSTQSSRLILADYGRVPPSAREGPVRTLWFKIGDDVREVPFEPDGSLKLLGDAPSLTAHFGLKDVKRVTLIDGKFAGIAWIGPTCHGTELVYVETILSR